MIIEHNSLYIGGEWIKPSSSNYFDIVGAGSGKVVARVPEAVEADIDRAVAAARRAFDGAGWADVPASVRAVAMGRFAAALQKRSSALANAVSLQNGMPITLSEMLEGEFSVGLLNYYASLADTLEEADIRPSQIGRETRVEQSAIGVVVAIVPWNFPVTLALSKIAPALIAGCTVVIKPSPGTVLDSYVMADAAHEAGIPPGVLNWVPADRTAGAYLVSHPGVDKVAFTGSTSAGRSIARSCGELLRPVTLELGGKSAAVILDDADLDAVINGLPMASLLNNGQACYNATRILAPMNRYEQVVQAISALAKSYRIGDPLDRETTMGPMASEAHRARVESFIAKGQEEGRLVAGGGRPTHLDAGWFVEPTVFADVGNHAVIAQEEIFGPVLAIIPYKDDRDAIQIANDSGFGLGGSVWSRDTDRALGVARKVKTGTIGINGYMPSVGAPFGGVKASGLGREFAPETLHSYRQQKSIYIMS